MQNSEPKSKVTLEELLRLKRAERPDQEFWANFEQELRQKQLTALVKKRRWWHDMPVLLSRRVYLPAGAAAVVAFTLVSVRQVAPTPLAQAKAPTTRIAVSESAVEVLPTTVVASAEMIRADRHAEPNSPAPSPARSEREPTSLAMSGAPSQQDLSTPSARSIAANLARLEQSEPELVNSVLGSRLSSPARAQTVAAVQTESEPAVAGESARKYRLIARYADRSLSPEPSAPALVRERIARRLGDDLGDGISRIGVVGSRVSLKF